MTVKSFGGLGCVLVAAIFAAPAFAQEKQETPVFWADDNTMQSEAIEKALRSPLTSDGLQFDDTPIAEIVDFLRSEYNIEVQLDLPALDDLGLSPDDPITCNMRNISLRSALNLMLKQLDLTYVIENEVLLITSQEEALTRLTVAVYPVGDLMQPYIQSEHMMGGSGANFSRLIDVITTCIAADTWTENGGPEGDLRLIQPGLLVVNQTHAVHEQISELLAAMRKARKDEHAMYTPEPTKFNRGVMGGGRGGGFGGESTPAPNSSTDSLDKKTSGGQNKNRDGAPDVEDLDVEIESEARDHAKESAPAPRANNPFGAAPESSADDPFGP